MKMRKELKEKGFPQITSILKRFEVGDRAAIKIDPSIHSGMPFHNFHGLTGVIVGKQGRCYLLEIKVGSVIKKIVVAPVHLKRIVS